MMDIAEIEGHMDVRDSAGRRIGQVDHVCSHVRLNTSVNDIGALRKAS